MSQKCVNPLAYDSQFNRRHSQGVIVAIGLVSDSNTRPHIRSKEDGGTTLNSPKQEPGETDNERIVGMEQ